MFSTRYVLCIFVLGMFVLGMFVLELSVLGIFELPLVHTFLKYKTWPKSAKPVLLNTKSK